MGRSKFIGFLLIIIGIISLFLVFNSGDKISFNNLWSAFAKKVDYEKTVDIQNIDNLQIQTGSMNIRVVKGQDEQALVRLHGSVSRNLAKDTDLQVEQSGNTLTIRANESHGFWFGFNFSNLAMTVELPEKQWDQIKVKANSGNIRLNELFADSVAVEASSGNVAIEQMKGNKIYVKANSGNLKLKDITGEAVELKTSSGNISMDGFDSPDVTFNANSGNVSLTGGRAAFQGKTTSGNIKLKVDELLPHSDLQANSGNVTVSLNKRPSSLAVDYRGGSGRGRIERDGFTYEYKADDRDNIKGAFGSGEVKLAVQTGSGNFTLK